MPAKAAASEESRRAWLILFECFIALAAILRNTRRVKVMLASHHPLRELFVTAATRLTALSP